jgi:hypothetical protein
MDALSNFTQGELDAMPHDQAFHFAVTASLVFVIAFAVTALATL